MSISVKCLSVVAYIQLFLYIRRDYIETDSQPDLKQHLFILLLIILGHICSASAVKQDSLARIVGEVRQKPNSVLSENVTIPLGGCVIQLFYENNGHLDSLYTVSAPDNGRFAFKSIPVQRIILKFQCLGYEAQSGIYDLGIGDNVFLMTLKEKTENIQESKVIAETPLLTRLRDTTIFNTQAIKSMSGDKLRDVLEEIPGFKISNNTISYNGERVSRTYVNGLLIFGDEAMNAVNSLKADEVTQVKVYDEQSAIDKHRGLKNSRKERVLNVITKESLLSLTQFGIAASGGADNSGQGRYAGAAATSFNSEMFNMEAVAWGSNIENASSNNTIYYTDGIHYFSNLSDRDPLKEYTERENVSTTFSKHWKNRSFGNSLRGSYDFRHAYTRSTSNSITEYFSNESTPAMVQLDSAFAASSITEHNFTLDFNLLDTPIKSLDIYFSGSLSRNESNSRSISAKEVDNSESYYTHEDSPSKLRSWSLNSDMTWTNNDVVKWRPEAEVVVNFARNTNLFWNVDTLETSFLKRQLNSDGYGNEMKLYSKIGVSANLMNTLERTFLFTLYASTDYIHKRSRQVTLDEWNVPTPVINLANSYDYTRNEITTSAVSGFDFATSNDVSIIGALSLNRKMLLNNEYYPIDFNKRKTFLYPEYNLSIKIPRWTISSALIALTPSIEQISNRVSDNNPLILTGGNPYLHQAFNLKGQSSFSPNISSKKKGSVRSFSVLSSAECTLNPIVNKIVYFDSDTVLDKWDGYEAKAGSMLYTYSNASRPSWNIEATGEYSLSMRYNIYNLRIYLSESYSQISQFSGQDMIWVGNWASKLNTAFTYRPTRKLGIIDHAGVSYVQSNDNNGANLSSRFIFSNSLSTTWDIIRKRLKLECNYSLTGFDYVKGFGKNHFSQRLNAELQLTFLKDSSLKLSLQGLDLLNSGSSYTSIVNASYMKQDWNPICGRYYLLNLSYIFRKKR